MSKASQLLKEIINKKEGFSFASVLNVLKGKKELKLPEGNDKFKNKLVTPAPVREEGVTFESLQQEIRNLAYANWEKAGYPNGDGNDFWSAAEQELFGPEPLKDGGYYVYILYPNNTIKLKLIK